MFSSVFFVEKPVAGLICSVSSAKEVQRVAIASDFLAGEIKEKSGRDRSAMVSRWIANLDSQRIEENLSKDQRWSLAFSSIDRIKSARVLASLFKK